MLFILLLQILQILNLYHVLEDGLNEVQRKSQGDASEDETECRLNISNLLVGLNLVLDEVAVGAELIDCLLDFIFYVCFYYGRRWKRMVLLIYFDVRFKS